MRESPSQSTPAVQPSRPSTVQEPDFSVVQDAAARARLLSRGDDPQAMAPGVRPSRAGMPDEFSDKGRIIRMTV